MRKWMAILLVFMFVLPLNYCALAEEEMTLSLVADKLIQTDDICTIYFKLYKQGGIEFCFEEPDVTLYDENNNVILPLSVEMAAPLNPVPQGDHTFPIILTYYLSEPVSVASYKLNRLLGQQYAEASATSMETAWSFMTYSSSDSHSLSIWSKEPLPIIDAPTHFIIAYIYGAENEYLGSVYLSSQLEMSGLDGDTLAYYLFDCSADDVLLETYGVMLEAEQEYAVYYDIPLDFVQEGEIPVSVELFAYYPKMPVSMMVNSFEHLDGNNWRICYLLHNNSCKIAHDPILDLTYYDENGQESNGSVQSFTSFTNMISPFSIAPYVEIVTFPDGFVPKRAELVSPLSQEYDPFRDEPYFTSVEGSYKMELIDGKWYVTASIPYAEGTTVDNYGFWFFATNSDTSAFYSCNMADSASISAAEEQVVFSPLEIYNWPSTETPIITPLYYIADFYYAY